MNILYCEKMTEKTPSCFGGTRALPADSHSSTELGNFIHLLIRPSISFAKVVAGRTTFANLQMQ